MTSITPYIVPTGGIISLSISGSVGNWDMSRSTAGSGGPFITIGSGVDVGGNSLVQYLDIGDQLNQPLSSGVAYTYRVTDDNGVAYTNPITPVCQLDILQEPLLAILMRVIQAGINNIQPSADISQFNPPQVLQAMPLVSPPPLPFITINLDLMQQDPIPIGQNVEQVNQSGSWVISGMTKRVFRVSVLANNVQTRDFYRDAIVGIFEAMILTVLAPMGLNISHKYQVACGQVAKDTDGMSPGFYYADVMLDFSGIFNIAVLPNYGFIQTLQMTTQINNQVSDTVSAS